MLNAMEMLVCPECRGGIVQTTDGINCLRCRKRYASFEPLSFNLIPSTKVRRTGTSDVERKSIATYNKLFDSPFVWIENPMPWGLNFNESYLKKLRKHLHLIKKILPAQIGVFCDLSAGSGRFGFDIIQNFKPSFSVLCDLSVDSIAYLTKSIRHKQVKDVISVRMDYLQPPFKEDVFDTIICNDTLIYGPEHESILLKTIHKILKRNGVAILDFANKYHRGFWHKPHTCGYSKKHMCYMLENAGFIVDVCLPLYYELSADLDEERVSSKILNKLLPPTRYVVRVSKRN